MKEITKKVTLRLEVEYSTTKANKSEEQEVESVLSLLVNPNFSTIEEGLRLQLVKVTGPNGVSVEYKEAETYGVYTIVGGFSKDCIFTGTEEECVKYGRDHKGEGEFVICSI